MFSALGRLLPPHPLARRLSAQTLLTAIGDGTFFAGSAVYFTHVVGLSASQVGLGLTLGGLAAFVLAVPLGRMGDRFGARRVWAISVFARTLLYGMWLFADGFAAFIAITMAIETATAAGRAARGSYSIGTLPAKVRINSMAYMRTALNIGYTVGTLLCGIVLVADNDLALRALPIVPSVLLAINGYFVTRLPAGPLPRAVAATGPRVVGMGALQNRGFFGVATIQGILNTNQTLLNVVIPLWLVERTDAPHVLLAWLFGTNTVLAVLLQVPTSRNVESTAAAVRAAWKSSLFFVVSCAIIAVTHHTVGWVTLLLLVIGHVTVTGAELYQSASQWAFMTELSEPERRGDYQGVGQLGNTLGSVWAPAVFTFLAMSGGTAGWAVIAGVCFLGVLPLRRLADSAERHLQKVEGSTNG